MIAVFHSVMEELEYENRGKVRSDQIMVNPIVDARV